MLNPPRAALSAGISLLAAAALSLSASQAHAIITLDANFDHGSLESYSILSNNINLVGRDNYYGSGRWKWAYFKANGVDGMSPNFRISDNFAVGSVTNDNWRYSYDNENWIPFDNHGVSGGLFQVSNNTAFTENEVWVSYSLPYSYGRAADKVAEWKLHPHVGPTISSNADLVIGQSPGGVDEMGRTVTPKDMWGFKITDPAVPSAGKTKIVLTSGLHAQEVLGNHALEGTLDWLLSDDSRAAELRKTSEVFVYPMLNPDGRYAGNNRGTIQNPNQDPNRFWSPTASNNWQSKPDLKLSGEAMMADLDVANGGEADYFIDYHSTVSSSSNPSDFMYIHPEEPYYHTADPFWTRLLDETNTLYYIGSTSTGPTTANFGEVELGADFDATYETAFHPTRGEDYYDEQGKDIGVAFFMALARNDADLNADGFVGIADINFLLSRWNQAVPVGDKDAGDLAGTGNGFIGIDDLNVVLSNWNTGTPPSIGSIIPEPTMLALLTAGMLTILRRNQV
jgi:zinc carboxypeptidase